MDCGGLPLESPESGASRPLTGRDSHTGKGFRGNRTGDFPVLPIRCSGLMLSIMTKSAKLPATGEKYFLSSAGHSARGWSADAVFALGMVQGRYETSAVVGGTGVIIGKKGRFLSKMSTISGGLWRLRAIPP
jgi:hypothetical protein